MKKRTKGFTLIELIITISLIVIVLGVIYTFFFSNSKTLTTNEINSDLQFEVDKIQQELLFYGTQANEINEINGSTINEANKYNYVGALDGNGKLDVTNLKFIVESEEINFIYTGSENKLELQVGTNSSKVLSFNVTEFKIRPLDYKMQVDNEKRNFYHSNGLEISLTLKKKKGYSDVTIPVSVIVKFRNK